MDQRSNLSLLIRASLLPLLALFFVFSASADPMQDLYRIEAEAQRSGWTAEAHQQAAAIWYRIGDRETAAAHLDAAAVLEPDSAAAQQQLAALYFELQRWPAAIESYRAVLRLRPGNSTAQYRLGLLLAPLNRQDALRVLQSIEAAPDAPLAALIMEVLQSGSDDFTVTMQTALLYAASGEWPLAEYAFTQAAALTGAPEAVVQIGLARTMQGKPGTAWVTRPLFATSRACSSANCGSIPAASPR
jgi:tetratricopeptide (TPR) repeat protein